MHAESSRKICKIIIRVLFLIYFVLLTKEVIFKKSPHEIKVALLHDLGKPSLKKGLRIANFTPFQTIKLYLNTKDPDTNPLTNLLGNLIGFAPLAVFLPLLFKRLRSFFKTVALVFLISLMFETFQLLTGLGCFDVDDLLLNTLGGMIGYPFFLLLKKITRIS